MGLAQRPDRRTPRLPCRRVAPGIGKRSDKDHLPIIHDSAAIRPNPRLDRRIAGAVREVCGPVGSRQLAEIRSVAHCRSAAFADLALRREAAIAAARRGEAVIASRVER